MVAESVENLQQEKIADIRLEKHKRKIDKLSRKSKKKSSSLAAASLAKTTSQPQVLDDTKRVDFYQQQLMNDTRAIEKQQDIGALVPFSHDDPDPSALDIPPPDSPSSTGGWDDFDLSDIVID